VGFAYGYCVYFQAPDWRNQSTPTAFQNKEYTFMTQGIYVCREIASGRMAEDCRAHLGAGVVGVTTEYSIHGSVNEGLFIHFTSFCTAIRRRADAPNVSISPAIWLKD